MDDQTPHTALQAAAASTAPPLEELTEWPEETKLATRAQYSSPDALPPRKLLNVMVAYETCTDGIKRVCRSAGIDYHLMWSIIHCDASASTRWQLACRRKATQHVIASSEELDNLPDDPRMYRDYGGDNQVLAPAAASLLAARAAHRLKLAQIAETGSTVPQSRSEVTSRNLNVSISTSADSPREVLDALGDLLGGR